MRIGLGLSLALGCAGFAVDASASPLLDLTGGTDGLGGLQAGTIGGGASAAYFNPALLTQVPFGFTLGFMAISAADRDLPRRKAGHPVRGPRGRRERDSRQRVVARQHPHPDELAAERSCRQRAQ